MLPGCTVPRQVPRLAGPTQHFPPRAISLAAGLQEGRGAGTQVLDIHLELIKDLQRTWAPVPTSSGTSGCLSSFTECPLLLTASNSHLNLGHIDLGLRPKPGPRGARAASIQAERSRKHLTLHSSLLFLLLLTLRSVGGVERRRP